MSNEYEYYVPNQENPGNNSTSQREPNGNGPSNKPNRPHKVPKVVSVICLGLVFGVVGATAFQATNVVADKILGKNQKTVSTSGTASSGNNSVSNTKLTQNTSTVTSDISDIVENAMPSVVSITNMSVQQVQNFFGGIQQQESRSSGSGIIIGQNDTELLVVTNNHVVEGNNTLTVTFIDNSSVEAQVKGTDPQKDLAVVAVPIDSIEKDTMDQIAVATLGDSTALKVGEPVIAIGNALGYGQSVTNGIVSAKDRSLTATAEDGTQEETAVKYIQTNAAINPGNSGGALLNANGEVIGINTAKVASNAVEGMGYAIPVSDVSDIIENLMNQVTRSKVAENEQGQLGIKGVDVSEESAQMYNMPEGVYISEAIQGGGAEKAGLTKGSIITKFDGTTIDSMETLKDRLQYYKKGETVEVTIQVPDASGEYVEQTVEVTLGRND